VTPERRPESRVGDDRVRCPDSGQVAVPLPRRFIMGRVGASGDGGGGSHVSCGGDGEASPWRRRRRQDGRGSQPVASRRRRPGQRRRYTCKRGGLRLPAPRPHELQAPSRTYAAARIPPLAFCGVRGSPQPAYMPFLPRSAPSRPRVAPLQLQQRQLTNSLRFSSSLSARRTVKPLAGACALPARVLPISTASCVCGTASMVDKVDRAGDVALACARKQEDRR